MDFVPTEYVLPEVIHASGFDFTHLTKSKYFDGTPAFVLHNGNGDPSDFVRLSVNLGVPVEENTFFLDSNSPSASAAGNQLKNLGIIELHENGVSFGSTFVDYSLYRFNSEKLTAQ